MNKVVLMPNPYRDKNFKTVRQALYVLKECGIESSLCLPFETDNSTELPSDLQFLSLEAAAKGAQLLICFGGDGTMLHAAKAATSVSLPILGVNIGTMGFMAEVDSGELNLLRMLAEDKYTLEERMMLDVRASREGSSIFCELALNEAIVTKGSVARTVHLDVSCDGKSVLTLGGDGVIVCTPTGSTAYSMSAGGPVVEPSTRNMILTPICPHDLMSKSFVLNDERTVRIKVGRSGRKSAFLSVDGGRALRLNSGDMVTICRAEKYTQFLHLKDRNIFEIMNSKFKNR